MKDIRESVHRELALGSEKFKSEIETLYGRRVTTRQNGRPRSKSNKTM